MRKYIEESRHVVYIILIFFIIVSAWAVSNNLYQIMLIQGGSMEPAYHNLQFVILEKAFTSSDIDSGDVIALKCEGLDSVLVKRVVAVPGDVAYIEGGTLYVNMSPSTIYEEGIFDYPGFSTMKLFLLTNSILLLGTIRLKARIADTTRLGVVEYEDIVGVVME